MSNRSPTDSAPGKFVWVERGVFYRRRKSGEIRYGISYMVGTRLVREMVGPTKTLARQALAIRRAEITQGKYKIPSKRKVPTFAEFCNRYMVHAREHKRSWRRDAGVLETARAFFGARRLDDITAWGIERYKAARAEKVTKASVNREVAILKRLLHLAVTWGVLEKNPAAGVELYREEQRTIHALTHEEAAALVHACSPELRPLVVAALNTGMRRGELFALDWADVDLLNGAVTVAHSKSGRSRRIPVNAALRQVLDALPIPREGRVFTQNGRPWGSIHKPFGHALRRSGIRRCRFHDLRHTFITNLVLAGVDLVTVAELAGHTDITMTRRYAHPSPENKRAAVEALCRSVAWLPGARGEAVEGSEL